MSATFTDDDIEKRVENASGEVIGTVTDVEGDTARVEPRSGVMDSIRAALGWSGTHDDTVAIHEERVDEISSETIRLRTESVDDPSDVPTETGVAATNAAERDPGTGADDGDGDSSESTDAMADATARNAAERAEEPEESSPIEPLEERDGGPASDEPGDSRDADELEETHTPDAPNEPGLEDETAVIHETGTTDASHSMESEPTAEATDEAPAADETAAAPDAMSGTRSADSPGEMDRAGVEDEPAGEADDSAAADEAPMDDAADEAVSTDNVPDAGAGIGPTAEPSHEDSSDEDRRRGERSDEGGDWIDDEGSESDASATDAEASEGTNPAEELDTGIDLESAADTADAETTSDATGTDDVADELDAGSDLEDVADADETGDRDRTGVEETDLAEELDTGVDLESASTDAGSDWRADARPETELDPDVEGRSGPETDPRPETELEPPADEAATPESGAEADVIPGVDIESAVDPDAASGGEIDPDAIAGSETEAEPTDEGAARERIDDETAAGRAEIDDETDAETADRGGADRAAGERSSSPLGAAFAAQRAAMTTGQELVKQGLTVQQRTARTAVEAPLAAQRGGLEVARTATRSYFEALAALTGAGGDVGAGGERPRAPDELLADLEDAAADDEFEERLSAHLEGLREMQAQLEEIETDEDVAASLLEEQVALLEACRQRLAE